MNEYVPQRPKKLGLTVFESIALTTLRDYIDWTPFFLSWELRGRYPAIFDDHVVGKEARKLFDDATGILEAIIAENSLQAKGVCGLFPANTVRDDDIEVYADENRTTVLTTLNCLRQQNQKAAGQPNLSLADYIAPKETGVADYIGAFVVTAGLGGYFTLSANIPGVLRSPASGIEAAPLISGCGVQAGICTESRGIIT